MLILLPYPSLAAIEIGTYREFAEGMMSSAHVPLLRHSPNAVEKGKGLAAIESDTEAAENRVTYLSASSSDYANPTKPFGMGPSMLTGHQQVPTGK